jgi:hypothetical protein
MVDQVCAIMFKYRQKNIRGGEQADLSRPKPAAAGRDQGSTDPRTPNEKGGQECRPEATIPNYPGQKPTRRRGERGVAIPRNRWETSLLASRQTLTIPRPNYLTNYLFTIYLILSHLNLIYLILSYYFISLPPIIRNRNN